LVVDETIGKIIDVMETMANTTSDLGGLGEAGGETGQYRT